MQKYMLGVDDVCTILSVKASKAYDIIRVLNKNLEKKGIMTVRGRVPRHYLYNAFGLEENE